MFRGVESRCPSIELQGGASSLECAGMVSRPYWKGHLRLSLVSCPVALYTATTDRSKIAFHLLNLETGHRLRRQLVDGETGDVVDTSGQVRGYEVSKGDYVIVPDEDLDTLAIESTHTIDIDGFVPRRDINDVYIDSPYYLVPSEKIGEEAFAVIREAMTARGMAGLGRVVLNRRERILMLEPHSRGIVATTLRYPYEIKDEAEFFGPIADVKVDPDMLDLAGHIIKGKTKSFDPTSFKDRYEATLRDLIAAKQAGRPARPGLAPAAESNVVDLMEALRRSVGGGVAAPVARTAPAPRKAGKKDSAPQTQAGADPQGRKRAGPKPAAAASRRRTAG